MSKPRDRCILLAIPIVLAAGCYYQVDPGVAITGRVTYRGKPVADGRISMLPDSNTKSRATSARITDGRFSIATRDGPLPGTFRVEVVAHGPGGSETPPEAAAIPEKYNRASGLQVTVPRRKSFTYLIDLE